MILLDIQNLHKSYPAADGAASTPVLRGISLQLAQGEIRSILGRSGSGKTTLLRIIAGHESFESGQVVFEGKPVPGPSSQRFMVFQSYDQLFPWKTIEGNIVFAIRSVYPQKNKSQAQKEAQYWLEQTGLAQQANAHPHQLSGGMKQRAALARAFALQPRLLLLDEPFSGLDMVLRAEMRTQLLGLCQQHGVACLFVTHDLDEAFAICESPLLLHSGGDELTALTKQNSRQQVLALLTLSHSDAQT